MVANPTPSIDAAGASVAGRTSATVVESPDQCLALIGALADGARHRLAALAARIADEAPDAPRRPGPSSVLRLVEALEAFRQSGMPLVLDADVVRARPFVALSLEALEADARGWDVRVVGSTTSTNNDLMDAIRAGAPLARPRLLATEMQLAGRGRLGRRWVSTPGSSLSASFALRIARSLSRIDGITLVCGLAVRDVVATHGVDAELKWPNDVLCDGRKLGGILVEALASGSDTAIVVGIGLNVSVRGPIELTGNGLAPTDLESEGGRALDRNRIAGEIAARLEARLALFARQGFAPFVDEWNRVDALLDRPVTLAGGMGERVHHGTARGVDATGALTVEIEGVRTRVISGDVSVRPTDR